MHMSVFAQLGDWLAALGSGLIGSLRDFPSIMQQLSGGVLISVEIFMLTLLFSLPLGMVIALGRMSKHKGIRTLTKFYISVMRGTPLMLQLIVVYFGPYILFGMPLSLEYRFYAAIIGFVLNYAAYFAEIYRSGIEAIPVGQHEAAQLLGFNRTQTFFKIILPQVIKRVLPPVTNEIITLVKDTSLAYAISVVEMFTIAKQLVAAESNMVPLFVAGIFYYVFNLLVAFIMGRIEKRLSYYQ